MKFKKYVKESFEVESKINTLDENFLDNDWNPDRPSLVQDELERFYGPVKKLIDEGKFEEARAEIAELERDLNELEAENSKKKFFKFPQFMINAERRRIDALKAKLPKNESIDDMDKRCEKCNTLLNDGGTCPKCDDGEEDYGDNSKLEEELSVREKLKRAYPELNFDTVEIKESREDNMTESTVTTEELSNKEKLKRAYPELNFDSAISENIEPEDDFDYDDDYDIDDDVEMDRRHAALYGGDRMYCDCGTKLSHDEYGSYCPRCEPHDPEEVYTEECDYDDTI